MSLLNFSTQSRKGIHLTTEEHIKLEALYNAGLTPVCIAAQIGGRSERTVRCDIAKGIVELLNSNLTTPLEYSSEVGQLEHDRRATEKGLALKKGKITCGINWKFNFIIFRFIY